jgi:hypothetical protein
MKFIEPKVSSGSFTCPHCNVISQQRWWHRNWQGGTDSNDSNNILRVGLCVHCQKNTVWIEGRMYFPDNGNAPPCNSETPAQVKRIYDEAAAIYSKSPRGAAALLRLAIQVLCRELGETGKNINDDIASLVKKGLPTIVQQSLDIVRVTGNDAVHPGQIDTDNVDTVTNLFQLVNIIVEYMIDLPKKVSGIYSQLPPDKVEGIKNRDK